MISFKKGFTRNAVDGIEIVNGVEKRKPLIPTILSLKIDSEGIGYECEESWGTPYLAYLAYFYMCTGMKVYDNKCISLKALWVGKTETF